MLIERSWPRSCSIPNDICCAYGVTKWRSAGRPEGRMASGKPAVRKFWLTKSESVLFVSKRCWPARKLTAPALAPRQFAFPREPWKVLVALRFKGLAAVTGLVVEQGVPPARITSGTVVELNPLDCA